MSESQFNYLFTLKNAHSSSSSSFIDTKVQIVIFLNATKYSNEICRMWPESGSVNTVNLAKKILQFQRYRIFLGDYFFGLPVYISN